MEFVDDRREARSLLGSKGTGLLPYQGAGGVFTVVVLKIRQLFQRKAR